LAASWHQANIIPRQWGGACVVWPW